MLSTALARAVAPSPCSTLARTSGEVAEWLKALAC